MKKSCEHGDTSGWCNECIWTRETARTGALQVMHDLLVWTVCNGLSDVGAAAGQGVGMAALQAHGDAVTPERAARHAAAQAGIDDLSRELTAEIEAHRVTRERAEAAENALHCLIEEVRQWASETDDHIIDDMENILAKYEKGGGS